MTNQTPELEYQQGTSADLDALFLKDPEELTEADCLSIVTAMRKERAAWIEEQARAAAAGTRPVSPAVRKKKAAKPVSAAKAARAAAANELLGQLGLDLDNIKL